MSDYYIDIHDWYYVVNSYDYNHLMYVIVHCIIKVLLKAT